MRMNLRRIREVQNLKLKDLAKLGNMDVERLRAIEQYKELPTWIELIRILKICRHYFDETISIIWQDIDEHYIPKSYNEYTTIQTFLKHSDLSTEDLERRYIDE